MPEKQTWGITECNALQKLRHGKKAVLTQQWLELPQDYDKGDEIQCGE